MAHIYAFCFALALIAAGLFPSDSLAKQSRAADRQVAQATAPEDRDADSGDAEEPHAADADADAASGKKAKKPTFADTLMSIAPFILIGVFFYLMIIRPQQRKSAESTALMKNLKKGDRVVTVGGILGLVVNTQKDSEQVTLLVDEGTNAKIRVLRSHLARVITDADKSGKSSEKDSPENKSASESAASEK